MVLSVESLTGNLQLFAATGSFTVCSMGMMVFNKLAVRAFPLASTLVAIQMGFTVLVLVTCFWSSLHIGSFRDALRWSAVVPFFVAMLLTSMFALQDAPMSLVITFRALSPLLTLSVERFFPNATPMTSGSMSALLLMTAGACLYARDVDSNDQGSWHAIGWIFLNTVFACTERLLQRYMLSKDHEPVDISKTGVSLINNLLGMFPMMLASYIMNEHTQILPTVAKMSHLDMLFVFLSCVVGVGISVCAIWAQSLISATSMLVLTNSNKFMVILIEIFLIKGSQQITHFQVVGAIFAILAGVLYARVRENEDKERKAAEKRAKEAAGEEEEIPLLNKKV